MRQVIQNYKTGKVSLSQVPVPQCSSKRILVQTTCSLISIGTERATISLGKKSLVGKAKARPDLVKRAINKARQEGIVKTIQEAMGRLDVPTPLGYSCAGVVLEAVWPRKNFHQETALLVLDKVLLRMLKSMLYLLIWLVASLIM